MFATIEEKVVIGFITALALLVGVLGYNHHERKQGAVACIAQQSTAEQHQETRDAGNVKNVLADFSADLAAIPIAASRTPPMLMCDAPSAVSQRPAARSAKPATLPISGNDQSVQTGAKPVADVGPIVQDITLSCLLGIADATELWQLALKESQQ